jgi:hypothetical protein
LTKYYLESLEGEDTLQKIAKDLKEDMLSEIKDTENYDQEERNEMKKLVEQKIDNDIDYYAFFSNYLKDKRCSFPELCGSIVGAMAKKEMFHSAIELIELNTLDENDELYWDT